ADRQRILAAVEKARQSSAAAEVEQLAANLAATEGKRAVELKRAATAIAKAQEALARGDNSAVTTAEYDAEKATAEAERMAARIATLEPMLRDARRKADKVLLDAAETECRALIASYEEKRRELLNRLAETIAPLVTELLVIDGAEAELYDPF